MPPFAIAAALLLSSPPAPAAAPDVTEVYRVPPKEIVDLVDAPLTPAILLSPLRDRALLLEPPPLISIADLARPELKLAGLRFDPAARDQPRAPYFRSMALLDIRTGRQTSVTGLPADSRVRNVAWSPNGTRFAFTARRDGGVELWVGEVSAASVRRLGSFHVSCAHPSRPYEWLPDGGGLVVRVVPEGALPPVTPDVPKGPTIQESRGRKAPARTYQDLLKSARDADLFEFYMQSVIARTDLDGKTVVLGRGPVVRADVSPDGAYVIMETLHRPFSYVVPEPRFPRKIEVWSMDGKLVREVADLPLADAVSTDMNAVRQGPRQVGWRADHPSTLYWVEAQDKGDPRLEADVRDRLFTLTAPFEGRPVELAATALRFGSVTWGGDDLALVMESWWKTRRTRTWRIRPGQPAGKPELVFDRSFEDRYADPGFPLLERTPRGTFVLKRTRDGRGIYLSGSGASPEGDRPFLDRFDLTRLAATRLWRSEAPYYEMAVDLLDDGRRLLTRRESLAEPPNFYIRDLHAKKIVPLTGFPDPAPQLRAARKELIRYSRKDGIALNGTLYLPPGYDTAKDGPLPVLMWAYPQEFKSADAAGQVRDSPYRFIRVTPGSPLFWLVRGWAVLSDPTMPIVGEGKTEPNDTYVEQLVASAEAAVEEVVRRGVGDRRRVAVGGHSYGAFMTANLLAHCDLFRAGLARSGAYNRTLTPFSFQAEERTFWEAPDTYVKMSPFTHASKIDEPLLMIHGTDDNNSGTFPIQSERLFQAVQGLGGTARLVMLPFESHGYQARESVLHMLWEMDTWLEQHVRHAGGT
jgi:dipeptidyl aminopeptidase/acylaminoacyl peptidase